MITIFSTPSCYKCNNAKRKLKELGIPFDDIEITVDNIGMLAQITDQMELPVIMWFDKTVKLDEAIKLFNEE